jgi:immune inhibitor A
MDDRILAQPTATGELQLIQIPGLVVDGDLNIIVLLIDFADREGYMEPGHYEDLLFSRKKHPTGSLADFYADASNGKVNIMGSVHGWLRMPETYAYYVGNHSGTGKDAYPQNCKKLAEDAAKVALENGIEFPSSLDKFHRGFVTALFLVHAGRGAEYIQNPEAAKTEIWSHKWTVEHPVIVDPHGLAVTTYLTVPQDCVMGVCAHELGHLAFQWQDFYDPNYNDDGQYWKGTGRWDLMASGSHNGDGATPAHPACLHKVQHNWIAVQDIKASVENLVLKPSTDGGNVLRVTSPAFSKGQYLLLENRQRRGFDKYIPGEGLLVWRVDESMEMYAPATPGMQLVQADGFQQLEQAFGNNQGDENDPFPGGLGITELADTGGTSTSFPGGKKSGVRLSNIRLDGTGSISLSIQIDVDAATSTSALSAVMSEASSIRPASMGKPKPPLKARPDIAGNGENQKDRAPRPRKTPFEAKKATKSPRS